jgi:CyaY protein
MDRKLFQTSSAHALEAIDRQLGALEHESLDVQLGGDVLTLTFADDARFVINAHSAASQIWMAAGSTAWHFDLEADGRWVAAKSGDELFATVSRMVSTKLGEAIAVRDADLEDDPAKAGTAS